jgi:hypothetical protein
MVLVWVVWAPGGVLVRAVFFNSCIFFF